MTDDDLLRSAAEGVAQPRGGAALARGVAEADLCLGPAACLKPVRDGVGSAVSQKGSTQAQQHL